MDDTMGLTYDDDAAAYFAHVRTGLGQGTVRCVLRSRDRYLLGLGILPRDAAEGTADRGGHFDVPEPIRAAHPDLFPVLNMRRRYVDTRLEREYVMRDTGLDADTVCRVIGADIEYMRRHGIVD
jgi:hypothetical protein